MGRPAKPIELHLVDGKKHLTKAEIADRLEAESEIRFGDQVLTPPEYVKSDKTAMAKWRELKSLYDGFDFVTSADVSQIGLYCKTHSEYIDLIERRRQVADMRGFSPEEETAAIDELESVKGDRGSKFLWDKIEFILSVSGIIQIDKAINSKIQLLTAMSDRLFLNPLSKIKNIPRKKEKPKETPLEKAGFGDL